MKIERLNSKLYEVESSDPEKSYMCDPFAVTCTCPDFQNRRTGVERDAPERRCKHLRALEAMRAEQTRTERLMEQATFLTEAQLTEGARQHNGTPKGAACWLELARRQNEQAALKELFR